MATALRQSGGRRRGDAKLFMLNDTGEAINQQEQLSMNPHPPSSSGTSTARSSRRPNRGGATALVSPAKPKAAKPKADAGKLSRIQKQTAPRNTRNNQSGDAYEIPIDEPTPAKKPRPAGAISGGKETAISDPAVTKALMNIPKPKLGKTSKAQNAQTRTSAPKSPNERPKPKRGSKLPDTTLEQPDEIVPQENEDSIHQQDGDRTGPEGEGEEEGDIDDEYRPDADDNEAVDGKRVDEEDERIEAGISGQVGEETELEIPKKTRLKKMPGRPKGRTSRDQLEEEDEEEEEESDEGFEKIATTFSKHAHNLALRLENAYIKSAKERKAGRKTLQKFEDLFNQRISELDSKNLYRYVRSGIFHLKNEPKFPDILEGDPYDDVYSTEFDETNPEVMELFKTDEERDLTIRELRGIRTYVDKLAEEHKQLVEQAERINNVVASFGREIRDHHRFLEALIDHEKTVKTKYLEKRIDMRCRVDKRRRISEVRHTKPMNPWTPERLKRKYPDPSGPPQRSPLFAKRRRGGAYEPAHGHSAIKATRFADQVFQGDTETEFDENVPDAHSVERPVTPPPYDRVVLENFGDHTPGKRRKYLSEHDSDSLAETSPVLADREWTNEEIMALNEGLKQFQKVPGRFLDIHRAFGGEGGELQHRTALQIKDKAIEIKNKFLRTGQTFPEWWEDMEDDQEEA